MTAASQRHPFLDDLAEQATLVSSILRQPVTGRAQVLKIVKAAGSLYLNQVPKFLGTIEGRTFLEYEANLSVGETASGLVSFVRNEAGEVTHLKIAFMPLGSVLSLAAGVKEIPSDELGQDLFL